ncbi:orotidine-5'-phosphate decarboxylase [Thermoleophilum album]|uniref:Orotidine-5'-phosphate decarboxylase n=1 Tax=Thermoleophilum album TaxID=29539 RepID=A0A1H6FS76_THEAL|nr:orotidine-5'-phosphate decarboxylase [Thermoleophilum album]
MVGVDPDPAKLWPQAAARVTAATGTRGATGGATAHADTRALTAEALVAHCGALLEAVADQCVAAKLQLACFERLGAAGWDALERVAALARQAGLLVIADGKRGDVPTTAQAYAEALFGGGSGPFGAYPGLGADAATLNPLLGRDALEPLVAAAAASGGGCFVLVRTSNPGAAELQDQPATEPLRLRLARLVRELGEPHTQDGLSLVGAVCGATRPDLLGELRKAMPATPFLLPGVGAQGGSAQALRAALSEHPASAIVTASRTIADAWRVLGGDPATAAARAAAQLRSETWP